jgi:hypothetical protein
MSECLNDASSLVHHQWLEQAVAELRPRFAGAGYQAEARQMVVALLSLMRSAKILYLCTNPLRRSAEAGSDAVSINMRRRSARARQDSERSVGLAI